MIGLIIVGVIVVLFAVFLIGIYNSLVQLRQRVQNAWSQVDVQLKRRYDLIPNLVNAVKGYAQHEKATFETVTQARNMAMNAGSVKEQIQAENMISGALRSLFAVAEAYPELKANTNFLDLQKNLGELEAEIQMARRYYNGTVRAFNSLIQVFPNNMLAGPFGFTSREYFEAAEEDRAVPRVQF